MGRVGNNEPQGQETIDESFPESEQPVTKPRSQAPSNTKPQTNRPHTEVEDDLYYVSSQDHHQDQMPAQFPPQNSEYHKLPNQHVPPPANMHFAHQVPSPPMGHPVMASPVQPFNVVAPQQNKAWNSSLFDCMNDPLNGTHLFGIPFKFAF